MNRTLALCVCLAITTGRASAQVEHELADAGELSYRFTLGGAEVGFEEVVYGPLGWVSVGEYSIQGVGNGSYEVSWSPEENTGVWTVDVTLGPTQAFFECTWENASIRSVLDVQPGDVHVDRKATWAPGQMPVFFENLVWAVYTEFALRFLNAAGDELPREGASVRAFLPATNGTIAVELESCERRAVADRGSVLDWEISFDGTTMHMVTDERGLLLELRVPVQELVVTLEGAEDVGKEPAAKTLLDSGPWRETLSAPAYEVVEEAGVRTPMRDGVELVADVFRPDAEGAFPAILVRTPYGRATEAMTQGRWYAQRGYVFVAQDVRGRFDSGGTWFPGIHEEQDGSDTIDWLAAQEWCDGNVGMIGASYVGWVQWFAAKSGNPHLKAIVPQVSPPDPLENFPYEGGVFMLGAAWWLGVLEHLEAGGTGVPELDYEATLETLPLTDLDEAMGGPASSFLDEWLAHPPHDTDYWKRSSYQHAYGDMDLAVLNMTGWFDGDMPGAVTNFPGMRAGAATEKARRSQFLVVGPWGHAINRVRKLGEVDFGREAVVDMNAVVLRFFDHYLKGVENGMQSQFPVLTFTMGENRWHGGQSWPLRDAVPTKLYFHSGGDAQRQDGAGTLVLEPRAESTPDSFVYDPEEYASFPNEGWDDFVGDTATMDVSDWEDRDDVLDFTSAPLLKAVEVTGPIEARLWVATDGPDTDFQVALFRQEPSGALRRLAGGIQRVAYRKGNDTYALVEPGEVVEIVVDCWATSQRFEKGDRLVVQVNSTAFPGYARNLNTGDPDADASRMRTATNTLYHDASRPSHLLLPIVLRKDTGLLRFEK